MNVVQPSRIRPRSTASDVLQKAADLAIVGFCTLIFAWNVAAIATSLFTNSFAGQRDFMTYWCSARQAVHRQNPYDAVAIGSMERAVGYSTSLPPLVMRNVPYSLPLVYPLGFLSLRAASLSWSAMMLVAAWLSVRLIRASYGFAANKIEWLTYLFAPLLSCFIAGQTAVFALLGLALFLKFYNRRPAVAGAALWLCALKPQNFVVFGVVLFLWIVAGRRWLLLSGAVGSIAASTALVSWMRPEIWHEYAQMITAAGIQDQFIACFSTLLRIWISPQASWLQWVPLALGSCWGVIYFFRHPSWDWRTHGRLLILISVTVAPYSWFMDQTLFLVALLPTLYSRASDRWVVASFAVLSAAVASVNLIGVPLGNLQFYPWTACIWLTWFFWAERRASEEYLPFAPGAEVT